MVVQWEDRFYAGKPRAHLPGDPDDMKKIYPDYVEMIKGFDVPVSGSYTSATSGRRCSGCLI
ncbi:MAG: hypothetical protein CM1200mP29_08730 [Verrucomicrobiota bacterium]|nr:MAG: hypothetical protein CM1200mP29_08730 [Verrucomicrobiota bacterium]